MRVITVPVSDRPECRIALSTALDLAAELSANVHGYHLLPHKQKTGAGRKSFNLSLTTQPAPQRFLTDAQVKKRRVTAQKLFQDLVQEKDFTLTKKSRYKSDGGLAQWNEITGSPEKVFSIIGPLSDLHVVTRPDKRSSDLARSFMLSALMYSGRPVLIIPQRKVSTLGKRIMLAWNQSMESVAAITAAIPLLQLAESVSIVSCGSEFRLGPKSQHLKEYLKQWNIKVQHIKTPGDSVESEIIDAYIESNSDLLVMGAYSRSQWREKIFGGVTNYFLHESSIPTLMLHRT